MEKKKAPLISKKSKNYSLEVTEAMQIVQTLQEKHFEKLIPVLCEENTDIFSLVHDTFVKIAKVGEGIYKKDSRSALLNASFAERNILESLTRYSGYTSFEEAQEKIAHYKNILEHPKENAAELAAIRKDMVIKDAAIKGGTIDIRAGELLLDSFDALTKVKAIAQKIPVKESSPYL